MPLDRHGKFQMNTQRAMAADKMPPRSERPAKAAKPPNEHEQSDPNANDEGGDSTRTTITHNPDGTHSVEHADGESTGPHAHLHEAMAHISMKHMPHNAHSHVEHYEDGTHTSHHAKNGEVSGPHEHESMDALHEHMRGMEDGGMAQGEGQQMPQHDGALMGM